MPITTSCGPDADGNFPEGAWVNIEPVYDPEKRVERRYTYFDSVSWADVEGVAQDPVIIGYKPQVSGNHAVYTHHHGLVLSLSEQNGYHDSDFYALVWNPETQKAERILYASTRGWSYDCGASVDATDEVKAAYKAKCDYAARVSQVQRKREASKQRFALARELGVHVSAIRRLEAAYGSIDPRPVARAPSRYGNHERSLALAFGFYREAKTLDRVVALVTSLLKNRLKNEFKKKLAQQVLDWLKDPAPRYQTPLSPKQAQYV